MRVRTISTLGHSRRMVQAHEDDARFSFIDAGVVRDLEAHDVAALVGLPQAGEFGDAGVVGRGVVEDLVDLGEAVVHVRRRAGRRRPRQG